MYVLYYILTIVSIMGVCVLKKNTELQKAIASAGLSALGTNAPGGATAGSGDPKKPVVHYRSIISDVFDGRLLSSVQCFTCESISSTKEVFQDLSLPIPSRDHLERLHHVPSHQSGDLSSASSSSSLNSMSAAQLKQQSLDKQHQGWMEWLFGWVSLVISGEFLV